MTDHEPFQLCIMAGMAFSAAIAVPYRLRSRTGESLDRTQEGWAILLGLRFIAVLGVIGLLAYLVWPPWMDWAYVVLPRWLRWCGVPLLFGGALFMWWTLASLGGNLTDTVVTRKQHTLVTRGPYHYMRHPFYAAYFIQLLGVSLLSANLFVLCSNLAAFSLLLIRTPAEEARLQERFGSAYDEYRRHTGWFWPRRP